MKQILYSGIIIIGVGAIAYMYYLSDAANKDSFSDEMDEAVKDILK